MNYFGTDLNNYGHYTWDLSEENMKKIGLMPKTPFDPYKINQSRKKGNVVFCKDFTGYTIIAIVGSCRDKRFGTKTVFWEKENLSKEEMIERIMSNKHSKAIIEKMDFDIAF